MKKILVKIISMLLTITMVLSVCMIAPVSVSATTQAENLITIARNEVASASANGGYVGSYNKYNDWADISGLSWCAAFVCWCAVQAGISTDIIHKSNRCSVIKKWYEDRALFYYSPYYGGSYIPKAGDLVIFDWDSVADGDHIGIVTGTSGNYLSTIEGNTSNSSYDSDCLLERTQRISLGSRYILGYCTPAYTDSSVTPIDIYNPDNYPFPTRDIYYDSSSVMTGSDVKWIQAVLYQLGYSISVDGSFGPASETVVMQFQSDYGLAVDGSVGPATRQKLYDLWTTKSFQACDIGTDFYAYITNTAYWLYLSNDYYNVSAKSPTYLTEQIWKFERQSDNSYVIRSSSDDTYLDVSNAIAANSTNVQTCGYSGSDAQKWYLIQAGDNKYVIRSKLGNYVLDLAGGSNVSGTNIQIYEPNGTEAQYFSIYKYDTPAKTNVNVEVDGTSVRVNWDKVTGCARYDVHLLQSPWGWGDIKYSKQIDYTMNYCEFKNVAPGDYAAFVVTKPNDNSTQSTWVNFTIKSNDLVPDNQIVHNGHIYSLYNDIMTWDEAKAQCENMGGHLVTVTSEEEQAVIEELVKNQFCKWYFMGATKIENGVDYKWITGEAFDYTNWKNETYDNIYENYLMATTNLNGAWQDTTVDGYSCLVGFICEVETEQISPVKIDCFNGHTYELYDRVLTWEDAEEFAKLKGGYLTAVTTEKEKDFIYDLSQNGEQYYYWLGGKGDNVNDYSWSNNEAFDYSNWAEGEPNNSNSIEHYLMQYKNSSEWNDTTNYQYLTGFVIEYDANTDSGTTGDCTWVFNIDTGELTISGDGNMDDYTTKSSVPWYSYRTDIKSVVFKDGVKNIGDMAFASCSNLTDVTLSDSVASIGNKSFLSCSSLANISSLKNIEIIEENAFTYCDTLENLEFSNNIHYIGSGAFTYTGWYDNQSDGMVYIGTILYKYKGTCPDEVIITDGTTSITATAFSNRTTLKSVVVPDSINAIPNEAFLGCSNLVNVELSKNISSIGSYAFRGCTSLTEITIPRNVTSIGEKALGYYSSDGGYAIVENFTICGYTETIAETYANENGIEFVDLEAEILLGDVNLNGIIDIKDVTEIQKYIAGTNNVNRNEFASADVNSDGIVNVMDATLIQKYCASLITEF